MLIIIIYSKCNIKLPLYRLGRLLQSCDWRKEIDQEKSDKLGQGKTQIYW